MRIFANVVLGVMLLLPFASFGQDAATVEGVPDTIQAGEKVTIIVTIDRAPNFDDASVRIYIRGPEVSIQSGCSIPKGGTKCSYTFTVPADSGAGTWAVATSLLLQDFTKKFSLSNKFRFKSSLDQT
jgi:hypothetical protein